jgi:hypothetical protein
MKNTQMNISFLFKNIIKQLLHISSLIVRKFESFNTYQKQQMQSNKIHKSKYFSLSRMFIFL